VLVLAMNTPSADTARAQPAAVSRVCRSKR
jgi:hypothetical protein